MEQRIIVAVIGIPLLLAILCVAPDWATAALLAALSVVGTHELLAAVCGPEKTRRWTALPAVMGILAAFLRCGPWVAAAAGHRGRAAAGGRDSAAGGGRADLRQAPRPDPAGCVRHGAGGAGHPGLLQLPAAAAAAALRRRTGVGAAGGGLLQRLGGPVYRYGLRQAQAVAAGKPPQDCGGRRGRPCRRRAGHGDLPCSPCTSAAASSWVWWALSWASWAT